MFNNLMTNFDFQSVMSLVLLFISGYAVLATLAVMCLVYRAIDILKELKKDMKNLEDELRVKEKEEKEEKKEIDEIDDRPCDLIEVDAPIEQQLKTILDEDFSIIEETSPQEDSFDELQTIFSEWDDIFDEEITVSKEKKEEEDIIIPPLKDLIVSVDHVIRQQQFIHNLHNAFKAYMENKQKLLMPAATPTRERRRNHNTLALLSPSEILITPPPTQMEQITRNSLTKKTVKELRTIAKSFGIRFWHVHGHNRHMTKNGLVSAIASHL